MWVCIPAQFLPLKLAALLLVFNALESDGHATNVPILVLARWQPSYQRSGPSSRWSRGQKV